MKKRIFVLALCMCMVFGLFPVNASAAWNTWSNSSDLGQMLANCATAQKGKTRSDLGLSGVWCAFFVGACARKVGIDSSILPPADGNHYTTTISGSGKPAATSTGWGYGQYVVDKCGGKKLTASDTPRAGDLAVWGSHVGIMISSTQCVSGNMGTDSATSVVATHSAEGGYYRIDSNGKKYAVNPLFYVRPNYGGSVTPTDPGSVNTISFPTLSFINITETNAKIANHSISNPNAVYCSYSGAIWSTSSLATVQPKTKNEIDSCTAFNYHYQAIKADNAKTSISNNWDFMSELQNVNNGSTYLKSCGKLEGNTTYYVRLFVIDKSGNVYLSNQQSFKTSAHGGLGSWTKVDSTNHKRTCSVCGATETQAHTWDSGSVTTAATCTATGVKTYTCTACKATKTETIAKKSHTEGTPQLEKTNMVTRCTVCNTVISSTKVIVKDMRLEDYLKYYPSEACSGFITPKSSEYGIIYRLPSSFGVTDPETGKTVPTGDSNGKLTTTKPVIAKNINPVGNLWYQIDDGFVYYGDVIFVESMIELNRTSKSICVGQTFNLIATVMPEDAENKDVIWTSSNDNIVKVITDHGTIQGIATGTAVVTATSAADPNVSATCTVTVKEHNFTYQVMKEPTASASGTLQGKCALCEGTTTVILPKLDTEHYSMVITKEPTMTTKGTAQYTLIDKTYGSVVISVELPCLTALTLPRSLTRIEAEAFSNVSADVIVIPANVKAIDELAFANCPNLRYLVFQGSPTTIASNILEGCSNVTIRCISGSYVSRWAVVMGYAVEEQ